MWKVEDMGYGKKIGVSVIDLLANNETVIQLWLANLVKQG